MDFPFKRHLAFFVVLVTVVSHGSGISFHNDVLKPLEEVVAPVAMLSAGDEGCGGNADFKPPKSSFTDYAAICNLDGFFSCFEPNIADQQATEPFRFLPEVYLDIFVPPQNLSSGNYV